MTKNTVEWDYSQHAAHYDKRADYSADAMQQLIDIIGINKAMPIGDIGAGTGKLTKELLKFGLTTLSVEPNDEMRKFGIKNTQGQNATWSSGTGEHTGLPDNSVYASVFGSSFNVVDQLETLDEVIRITLDKGWFGCMWNHRDLENGIQKEIENIIKSYIDGYDYGLRRIDPSNVINSTGKFGDIHKLNGDFTWQMAADDIITAWRSHATLRRQADNEKKFNDIINDIETLLSHHGDRVDVPYTTRIYVAQIL